MNKSHRASEYETVRKEMSDRLLFVYGLLPAYASVIAAYSVLVIGNVPRISLQYATLPLIIIASVFCFVSHNLLSNIYNSGSYLIVYHELGSEHQYMLRSRFLSELVRHATGAPKPKRDLHLTDTAQTMGISYFFITLFSTALFVILFDWSSLKYEFSTLAVIALIIISILCFFYLFVRLWHVKSTMEDQLLQYKVSQGTKDTDFIFQELNKRYHRLPQLEPNANPHVGMKNR